uniref:Uncharacterized protein n=1 Tax=Arundo donax TaxID=35708 RepID=A0A0A9AT74_ARUDO
MGGGAPMWPTGPRAQMHASGGFQQIICLLASILRWHGTGVNFTGGGGHGEQGRDKQHL